MVRIAYEQNAGTITTNATGKGTFPATKLRAVEFAIIKAPGYVIIEDTPVGQNVPFQVYQGGTLSGTPGTMGAFSKPTAAVSFDPSTMNMVEFGT